MWLDSIIALDGIEQHSTIDQSRLWCLANEKIKTTLVINTSQQTQLDTTFRSSDTPRYKSKRPLARLLFRSVCYSKVSTFTFTLHLHWFYIALITVVSVCKSCSIMSQLFNIQLNKSVRQHLVRSCPIKGQLDAKLSERFCQEKQNRLINK